MFVSLEKRNFLPNENKWQTKPTEIYVKNIKRDRARNTLRNFSLDNNWLTLHVPAEKLALLCQTYSVKETYIPSPSSSLCIAYGKIPHAST